MSHDHYAIQIQMKSWMLLPQKQVGQADILKRSGPTAARIPDAPVFRVESRDARGSQRLAHVSGVLQTVLCAPVASVNVQKRGIWGLRMRQADFEKLIRVGTVGDTLVRWRLRFVQYVFCGHEIAPRGNQ